MKYKCKICGINDVYREDEVCELCVITNDPYAQSILPDARQNVADNKKDYTKSKQKITYVPSNSTGRKILIHGGTSGVDNKLQTNKVPVVSTVNMSVPQLNNQMRQEDAITDSSTSEKTETKHGQIPISAGIIKNVSVSEVKMSKLRRWGRALFSGIPFSWNETVVSFQVFPDYSGLALNAMGNACDQVVVYGRMNAGTICENNNVEIYGRRGSDNVIIAKYIRNIASGATIFPNDVIGTGGVWILTVLLGVTLCL